MNLHPDSLFKGGMRTKTLSILLPLGAALLALPFSGCASSSGTSSASTASTTAVSASSAATSQSVIAGLAGQSWKLDKWTSPDGSVQDPGPIDIAFAENNRFSGFGSVNRYMGGIAFTKDGDIDLSRGAASTMMAGPPEAMARESRYLKDLTQVRQARLDHGRLILTGENSLRFEFVPKK